MKKKIIISNVNFSPKVSVIIPIDKGSDYLRQSINSVLSQTYKNIEIIVVNYGSNDDVDNIVKSYGNSIRYFKKEYGCVPSALNYGIEKMSGEYFCWLSYGDMYYPNRIEKQVKCAIKFKDIVVIASNWSIIDENDNVVEYKYVSKKIESNLKEFLAFDIKTSLKGCSLLIPKNIIKEIGLFNEQLKTIYDYDYFSRISEKFKIELLEQHLLYSSINSEQCCLNTDTFLNDSDLFRSRLIKNLEYGNVINYFDNDINSIIEAYNFFVNSNYKRSSASIIKFIIKYYQSYNMNFEILSFLNNKLLGFYEENNYKDNIIRWIERKKTKKRLLISSGHWLTGGVERVLSILLNYLADYYDVILVTPYTEIESQIILSKKISHIIISDAQFTNDLDLTLFSITSLFDIDLVIGFMNLFDKVLDFYKLLKGLDVKIIASNHEHYFFPYKFMCKDSKIIKKRLNVYKDIDVSLWLTNYSRIIYNSFNNNGYTLANPNLFSAGDANYTKNNQNSKNILCVGRFNDYVKRLDRMLLCFSKVLKKVPDAKLVLVGKFDENSSIFLDKNINFKQYMNILGLDNNNVHFEGEKKDLKPYYKDASVLMSTSIFEGFPMVFNEAAMFGVPVVCNEITGIEDIVTDGENGFIVSQDDLDEMADKIVCLLEDKELRDRMSKKSKKLSERFDADIILNKWKLVIDLLLSNEDPENIKKDLDKNLNSIEIDYKDYFYTATREMNDIFLNNNEIKQSINNVEFSKEIKNQIYDNRESFFNKTKRYYYTFVSSIKINGVNETIRKIIKKILNKIKKL